MGVRDIQFSVPRPFSRAWGTSPVESLSSD